MPRDTLCDESVLPSSHMFNALRQHQRQVIPDQHVSHDLGARPANKTPRPACVIGLAHVKRPVENRDHLFTSEARIKQIILRQCHLPILYVVAKCVRLSG